MKKEQQLTAEEAAEQYSNSINGFLNERPIDFESSKIDFIAGWNAHAEYDRWIPVTERLPDDDRWVRVKGKILPHVYDNPMWFEYGNPNPVDYVTEWKDFEND